MSDNPRPWANLTHADTIHYEIQMLRFAARRLEREKWEEPHDAWVYEEDFLTHYCCLVDFLGKSKPTSPTTTDVHVTNLREKMQLKTPSEVDEIYAEGQKLFAKYGDKAGR
ncbi:MAG: hypothetical protein WBL50_24810 [Candidatus Acidiferrum sp.]